MSRRTGPLRAALQLGGLDHVRKLHPLPFPCASRPRRGPTREPPRPRPLLGSPVWRIRV